MSGISFLSVNEMDDATISLTSGTANAQFPLSNLQNESPSIKFRSTGSSVTILVDTLTTSPVDSLALVGDPTGSLGILTATFKHSVTTDFSLSTPISVTLSSEHNMGLEYLTSVSDRYWQIELTGSSYVEVGNIFIGERINLPQNSFSVSSFRYSNNDKSTFRRNEYGQRFIDKRNNVKSLSGAIESCTQDETETLDDMFQRHGDSMPLWVVLDKDSEAMNDGEFRLSVYGYMPRLPSWSASGGQLYNTQLTVEQAI